MSDQQPPAAAQEPVRDGYGFEVAKEHAALYEQYAPLWEAQESEREAAWTAFLLDEAQAHASEGRFDSLHSLAAQRLPQVLADVAAAAIREELNREHEQHSTSSAAGQGTADGQQSGQRLYSLVEGGLPSEIRGVAWTEFLGVPERRQEGYYAQLVDLALGPLQNRRGVEPEELREQAAASAAALVAATSAVTSSKSSHLEVAVHEPTAHDSLHTSSSDSLPAASNSGNGDSGSAQPVSTADISIPMRADTSTSVASATMAALDSQAWARSGKTWLQQIEKDLLRTFPSHRLRGDAWADTGSPAALRRVLAAYALHNPGVGYCQGLNFVAACLLQFMPQEDVFYCLCAMVEEVLPGYYSTDMLATQVDQRVFKRLIEREAPELAAHLESNGTDISCVFAQWFLCAFVNFLPMETCLRVWDLLFLHCNSGVLFAAALALLEVFGPALKATGDVLDAFELVQSLPPLMFDAGRLVSSMCTSFPHVVDGSALEGLRAEAQAEVLSERKEEAEAARAVAAEAERRAEAATREAAEPLSKMALVKKFLQKPFSDSKDEGKLTSSLSRERSDQLQPQRRPPTTMDSSLPAFAHPLGTPQTAAALVALPTLPSKSQPLAVPAARSAADISGAQVGPTPQHGDAVAAGTSLHSLLSTSPVLVHFESARSISSVDGAHLAPVAISGNTGRVQQHVQSASEIPTSPSTVPDAVMADPQERTNEAAAGSAARIAGQPGALAKVTPDDMSMLGCSESAASSGRASPEPVVMCQAMSDSAGSAGASTHLQPVPAATSSVKRLQPKRSAAAVLAMKIALQSVPEEPLPSAFVAASQAPSVTASSFNLVLEDAPVHSNSESFKDEWVNIVLPDHQCTVAAPRPDAPGSSCAVGAATFATPLAALQGASVTPVPLAAHKSLPSSQTSSRPPSRPPTPPLMGLPGISLQMPPVMSSAATAAAAAAALQAMPQACRPSFCTGSAACEDSAGINGDEEDEEDGRGVMDMRPDDAAVAALNEQLGVRELWGQWQTLSQVYLQVRGEGGQSATLSAMDVLSQIQQIASTMGSSVSSTRSTRTSFAEDMDASEDGSSTSRSDHAACLAASRPSANAQMQLLLALGNLRRDLDMAQQQQQQQLSALDALHGLCQEMTTKMQEVAPMLAERDKMISALTYKLNKVVADLAIQDCQLADREDVINELRQRIDPRRKDYSTRDRFMRTVDGSPTRDSSGGSGGDGRWTKLFKGGFKFGKEDAGHAVGLASAGGFVHSGSSSALSP